MTKKRKRTKKKSAPRKSSSPRVSSRKVGVLARRVRRELGRRGSPVYARRMQMFFKYPVRAYGCRTAFVRGMAARLRRELGQERGDPLLLALAEEMFSGGMMEESTLGVALLERGVKRFGDAEFRRLERWLRWVGNWAACDGLCTALLGPLVVADRRRVARVFLWAKSKNRWRRRAAAVTLVPAGRRGLYTTEILRLSSRLLEDDDDMVQKGVGWLLKETSKEKPREVIAYLLQVRRRAPRLVLRLACEKLTASDRRRVLG